jgi:hypothetical protein
LLFFHPLSSGVGPSTLIESLPFGSVNDDKGKRVGCDLVTNSLEKKKRKMYERAHKS